MIVKKKVVFGDRSGAARRVEGGRGIAFLSLFLFVSVSRFFHFRLS
jgi:hypothetical protein